MRRLKRWVYTRAVQDLADLIICPSGAVQDELTNSFGVRPEQTALVPNGVDVQGFPDFPDEEKSSIRTEFGVGPDELMLISVGRIDTQKGYDILLEAVSQVGTQDKPFKLVIVGGISNGPTRPQMERYQESLKSFVSENGLEGHVHFAGWRDDCPLLLRAADVYVHAARWEGWPLAVVEAMSAELPIVTTDCSGRPFGFVDGEHGWVCPDR